MSTGPRGRRRSGCRRAARGGGDRRPRAQRGGRPGCVHAGRQRRPHAGGDVRGARRVSTCHGTRSRSTRSTSGSRPRVTTTAISTQLMASLPEPARRAGQPDAGRGGRRDAAAAEYAAALPALDLVHLGIGDDGHTASLVPGDPVLDVVDRAVARDRRVPREAADDAHLPAVDAGGRGAVDRRRRVQARSGGEALAHDPSVPAGRVAAERMLVLADRRPRADGSGGRRARDRGRRAGQDVGKDVRALDGLGFGGSDGHVFGLLGPNGAGKSTAVKILTTLARADSGTAASPASTSTGMRPRCAAGSASSRRGRASTAS